MTKRILRVLTVLALAILPSRAFTLKDVLSSPFPYSLTASPKEDLIAWVFNQRGIRNIWIARAPDFHPRKLTNYAEDDGQEISQLVFSPDGETILFVRGEGPNREGEHPNPTSDPRGAKREVWAVSLKDGRAWKIGEGTEPAVSPRGDVVVFRRGKTVLYSPLKGSEKPRVLFKARGRNQGFVWSPCGEKLAFVSRRGDHSFVGIYDFKKGKILWVLPDVNRDSHPVWSPDGKKLAFIRIPGATMEFDPIWRRWDVPFSVWVFDVTTGKGRKVFESQRGSGFALYYPRTPLLWPRPYRLVFYSEQDGWMHLYSLNLKTGRARCLTPGNYEVENLDLSPGGKYLVFNSNKEDIDRRHLWTVSVAGGPLRRITRGKTIEWSPRFLPSGNYIAFLWSSGKHPASVAVLDLKTGKRRSITDDLIPASFPENLLVEAEPVVFRAGDGLEIHGQLFLPRGLKEGEKRPALIFMHGGPIRQMLLGWHYFYYYHNSYAFNQYMVNRGFVVLSVNYRSGIGYGASFRTAPHQGPEGASEYQDILAAARFLQRLSQVDPLRIGLWGGSYGGYLTALGLARDSDLFAAGVDLHGVHDWSWRGMRRGVEDWGISRERLRLARLSSPVADLQFWTSPVLFIHGDDDRNVDFIQTVDLVQRLRRLGRAHVETLVFPDEVHDFLLYRNWLRAYEAAADFFLRFLSVPEAQSRKK